MINESVNVAYTADTGQYVASMGEMITATARYGQVADGLVGRISKFGTAVTKTALDWTTMGKSMNAATQTAAAYQQAFSQLEARTVVAGGNFKDLSKQVRQMAREMPGGLNNAIAQVDALAKMGVTANKNLVPLAVTMSRIGAANGEMGPQLTQSFAQLNRTFKSLDVTSVDRIGASLTQVASQTGASASSIVEFSNAIAPLSNTLGMTKTQVLGFSAAFSRSGQDGYLAANVMNKMLGDMERAAREGTGELTTYATAVGKTTDQFADLVKSNPGEALTQVFDALSKGGSDSIRTLEKMGFEGPRAMKTLTAVAQAGGVREAISSAMAGYGGDSTMKGAEAAFGGLNDELSKVQESMTQMVEASGRPLLGFLTDATKLANSFASAFAGVANSDVVQSLAAVTMFGGGILGTAGKVVGTAATVGGVKQLGTVLPGMIATPLARGMDALGRNRSAMVMGGLGAIGVGSMAGNSTLATLGTGALLLSNFGSGSRMMHGLRRIGGAFTDAFYSGPMRQNAVSMIDSLQGVRAERWGAAREAALLGSGMSANKLDAWFRGNDAPVQRALDRWEAQISKGTYERTSASARRGLHDFLRDEYRNGNPMQWAAKDAVRSTGAGMRGLAGTALAGTAGLIMSPVGMVAGAAAAGIGGYMMYQNYQGQRSRWGDEGFNSTRTLSEQYGIALAPVMDFTKALTESVKTVDTWNEALNITGDRRKKLEAMYASGDTENVRMRISKDASQAEVLAQVQAAGNAQSPAFMSALLNDVAAQRGVEFAQQIAEQVKGTQGSNQAITDAIRQIASDAESSWNAKWMPGYTGQSENIEQVKGATEQYRAKQRQAFEVGGAPAQNREKLQQYDELVKLAAEQLDAGKFDEELFRQAAAGIGIADTDMDYLISGIKGDKMERDIGFRFGNSGLGHVGTLRDRIMAEAMKPVDNSMIRNAKALSSRQGQQYAQTLSVAQTLGLTNDELVNLWEEQGKSPYLDRVQNNLAPGQSVRDYLTSAGMSQQAYVNAAAVSKPQNVVAQWNAVRPMMGSATQNVAALTNDILTGNLSDSQRESYIAQMGMLQQYGMPIQMQQMGASQARGARMSLAKYQEQLARQNPGTEGSEAILNASLAEQQAVQSEELAYLQNRARAAYDYQKQQTRAWEDYYQDRAWAEEDFQQSQAWAEEDYLRQRGYVLEDFRRQQTYAEEDFKTSMTRMAEDTAKGIIDPFQRMQSQGIWSLEGMTQNVEEQQRWLRDQLKALDDLKKRGLSQQAIDTFGLADPGKAQQVAFYAGASDDEIEKANKLAKRQARLGKKFSDPELNQSARRAVEDFQKNTDRAAESLDVTLGRMDESFRISTERAAIQFTKQMDRMAQKMSKTMARMHQDFIDQDKEVLGNKKQLMRSIEDVYENRTAKWGPIFGNAMDEVKKQNTKGWGTVESRSDSAMVYIAGTWRKFSLDGTVPNKTKDTWSDAKDTANNKDTDPAPKNKVPKVTETDKSPRRTNAMSTLSSPGPAMRIPHRTTGPGQGGIGGPVSSAGGSGNWNDDLKAKYKALMDTLKKYGPLNRVGLIKGAGMKTGGTKAALWLWQQMLADGFTPEQAAGVLGNLDQESGFSPAAKEGGGTGEGRGIAQWGIGARWADLLDFAKANKMDPWELGTQYAFMKHEMDTGAYKFNWADFNATKGVQGAAKYFGSNYEGFGIEGSRNSDADFWYDKFKDIPAGKKKADAKWKNASLWAIGDEIDRRGKEYEKLLKQIKKEERQRQMVDSGGPIDWTHTDEFSEKKWQPPLHGSYTFVRHGGTYSGDFVPGRRGDPVYAVSDGKVHDIRMPILGDEANSVSSYSYGNTIVLDVGDYFVRYAHLRSGKPYASGVTRGASVRAGQLLGWVGATGNTGGSPPDHLHFEIAPGYPGEGQGQDPMAILRKKAVAMALGGVATKAVHALIGEAGDREAVIPLNGRGVGMIAEAIGKYAMTYEARMARTAQHGTSTVTNQTYVQDYSTQFNGDIKLQANDPDEMARKLEARQRRQNTYAVSGRKGRR